MKRAIIIMAKAPVAGAVKTRLAPFLSAEECAELAAAFLLDAFRKAKTVCENTILAYSPAAERNFLTGILPFANNFIGQTGANLGERMSNAFESVFASGADSIVMIGTDSPTVPTDFIERGFALLENESDVVLGKTTDGGFYLIGLRGKNHRELFENVSWSSASVFEQTVENAARLKLRSAQIPEWFDVDTPDDLIFLRGEMFAGKNNHAPATFQWLLSHSERFDEAAKNLEKL